MNDNTSEYHLTEQDLELVPKEPSIGKRLLLAGLVAFLFAGLGTGMGMAYRWAVPRLYQSEAKIFVDEPIFAGQQGLGPKDYLGILKSDQILVRAIGLGEFENFEVFADSEPLQSLRNRKSLRVEEENKSSDSGVIRLVFRGSNPEECSQVLQGVMDSFKEFNKASNDAQKQSTEHLSDSLTTARDEIKEVEDEIQSLTSNLSRDPNQEQRLAALRKEQGRLQQLYDVAPATTTPTNHPRANPMIEHVNKFGPVNGGFLVGRSSTTTSRTSSLTALVS